MMSNYQLDVDSPYPKPSPEKKDVAFEKPSYNNKNKVRFRTYGVNMQNLINKVAEYPEGEERDELVRITANHMKRSLYQWSHGSADDEKVASDLARFTDGVIQLDLKTFTFEKINEREFTEKRKKKK